MFYSTTANSSSNRAFAGRSQTLNSSIARSCSSEVPGSACGSSHALSHARAAPANSNTGGGSQSANASTMGRGLEEYWYCHVGMQAGASHYSGPWLKANTEVCLTCSHNICRHCTIQHQEIRY